MSQKKTREFPIESESQNKRGGRIKKEEPQGK
jgi:hypothetical protein